MQQDRITRILTWFQKARPTPDDNDFHSQLGCHFEEFAEMISNISPQDEFTGAMLTDVGEAVSDMADYLKKNRKVVEILPENRAEFLDSILDQTVTGVGVAWTQEMNVVNGLDEVNRSNFSKFDDQGQPIFDDNKKVMKGPNYSKADLTPFV